AAAASATRCPGCGAPPGRRQRARAASTSPKSTTSTAPAWRCSPPWPRRPRAAPASKSPANPPDWPIFAPPTAWMRRWALFPDDKDAAAPMSSQSRTRLPLAAAALAIALLAGCAGTAPRAQMPADDATVVAATGFDDGADSDAGVPGDTAATTASVAIVDDDAALLPVHGDEPATDGEYVAGADADPTLAEFDFTAIYGGDVYDLVPDPSPPAPVQ